MSRICKGGGRKTAKAILHGLSIINLYKIPIIEQGFADALKKSTIPVNKQNLISDLIIL